jgi:hypothetical protein
VARQALRAAGAGLGEGLGVGHFVGKAGAPGWVLPAAGAVAIAPAHSTNSESIMLTAAHPDIHVLCANDLPLRVTACQHLTTQTLVVLLRYPQPALLAVFPLPSALPSLLPAPSSVHVHVH